MGRFRSGIQLELAMDLYGRMVAVSTTTGSYPTGAEAKRLAASAFSLSEAFLDEMDKHFRIPPPPENNGRK